VEAVGIEAVAIFMHELLRREIAGSRTWIGIVRNTHKTLSINLLEQGRIDCARAREDAMNGFSYEQLHAMAASSVRACAAAP